ncbi:recombinase family protein [Actinocorallia aurea]
MATTPSDDVPVLSYARISADIQRDEHGVNHQHAVNRATAARLGWTIVDEVTDNDKSAAKADVYRDGFEFMIRALKKGALPDGRAIQGVIVVADDRLVRRPGDYERFVEAITHQDGRVYADARGPKDLYSEDVESMGLIGAVFSRIEVRKIQRRARQDHRRRALAGRAPGGRFRAFGWKEDRRTLEPAEADAIAWAVARLIAGTSANSICRELHARGLTTPVGGTWSHTNLRRVLMNPRICGWRMINGELIVDPATGEPVQGDWEPIVTPDQWRAVRAIFESRRGQIVDHTGTPIKPRVPHDLREHRWLLGGILRCGNVLANGALCNTPLSAAFHQPSSRHRYFCKPKLVGSCGGLARRGDLVDEFVSEAVIAKLEQREAQAPQGSRPWAREVELTEKIDQLNELRIHFARRSISNSLFFAEVERLEPEIAQLRADRERHSLAVAKASQGFTEIRRRWYSETDEDRLDIAQKRAYIREAVHAVIVRPAGRGTGKRFNPDLLEIIWREN